MWTWTHLMVSTIVLGPSPAAFLGTILPDTFDYVNWVKNFRSKKVNVKLLLKDEHKFNKKNNEGLVWEIDQLFHSFSFTAVVIGLTFYLHSVFFAAWALHNLTDYLTHTDQIYPFFPFTKWGLKLGIINYNPRSLPAIISDIILLALTMKKLGLV